MISAFGTGFALGFGLIFAIGAQNSFVLRQGLISRHVFAIALFCALADGLLIAAGIAGVSLLISAFVAENSKYLFGGAALWLLIYSGLRFRDAVRGGAHLLADEGQSSGGLGKTLSMAAVLTFFNPHVYLDTVVLIGTVSQQFNGGLKLAYGAGAMVSSFVFFFGLAYGARLLAPQMKRRGAWRVLDTGIGIVMLLLAIGMAHSGGWI